MDVKICKLTKIISKAKNIELCSKCNGNGWFWSDLGFGDIPGDEVKICCRQCGGKGRVILATIEVEAMMPFDFEITKDD